MQIVHSFGAAFLAARNGGVKDYGDFYECNKGETNAILRNIAMSANS
jgi:hypothetical protein